MPLYPPDNWCPHCKQAVRLSAGRHFCEELLGYVFGIELEPMTDERFAQWKAGDIEVARS